MRPTFGSRSRTDVSRRSICTVYRRAEPNFERAVEALYWPDGGYWSADKLKGRVTTFWGGEDPWSVVIPNDRLVAVVNEQVEYQRGWFLAQIPLATKPEGPKDNGIPLMGLAAATSRAVG